VWARASGKKENDDSNYKFTNLYFPGSKSYQKFTGARSNHQEHSATIKTQKAITDCLQKFKQNCSFQSFQEIYGLR
jgi:hypothetical protein